MKIIVIISLNYLKKSEIQGKKKHSCLIAVRDVDIYELLIGLRQ